MTEMIWKIRKVSKREYSRCKMFRECMESIFGDEPKE